jgi:hypothetical protein
MPGRVQDHEHRAVRHTIGGIDHPRHFLDTQDLGQPTRGFGVRRVIKQVAPLQHLHEEEAQRRDMQKDRQRAHLSLAEQVRLIRPKMSLIQPVGSAVPRQYSSVVRSPTKRPIRNKGRYACR